MSPVSEPSLDLRGGKAVSSSAVPSIQANLPFLTPRRALSEINNPYPLPPPTHTQYTFLQARNVQSTLGMGIAAHCWVSLIVHPPNCQFSLLPNS